MSASAEPFAPATLHALHEGAVMVDRPGLGLLAIAGADAATFLHGQLSSNVKRLAPGQGQWTTYNSPKGRMLATMFLYRPPAGRADSYRALLSAEIAEPVRKRLAMYVLRSRVAVTDDFLATRTRSCRGTVRFPACNKSDCSEDKDQLLPKRAFR